MAKLIGLLAWMTSIGAVFTPLLTVYPVWLALILAAVAGLLGGKLLPVLTLLTCLANLFLFSPVSSTALGGSAVFSLITTAFLFSIALGGLVLGWKLHAAKATD